MRLPRPRFTLRRLMVAVAVVAVLLVSALAWMRPEPPAPVHVLDQLPLRIQRLKPGMTERRVWWELGLAGYRKGPGAGGGSLACHWQGYSPAPGYNLVLSFDEMNYPPRFVRAHLFYPHGAMKASDPTLLRTRATR
jgi:hypothetical protein